MTSRNKATCPLPGRNGRSKNASAPDERASYLLVQETMLACRGGAGGELVDHDRAEICCRQSPLQEAEQGLQLGWQVEGVYQDVRVQDVLGHSLLAVGRPPRSRGGGGS